MSLSIQFGCVALTEFYKKYCAQGYIQPTAILVSDGYVFPIS